MRRQLLFRVFMLFVGIATAMVITMSQAANLSSTSIKEKAKTESKSNDESAPGATYVAVAADIVISGSYVHFDHIVRSLLETIKTEASTVEPIRAETHLLLVYFNVLFRAIISPNAP